MTPRRARREPEVIADSAPQGRPWCPGCEPGGDPSRDILELRRCEQHPADETGLDDLAVRALAYLSGSAESGGAANRHFCDLIHRPGGG
jgi:hypothetical protein